MTAEPASRPLPTEQVVELLELLRTADAQPAVVESIAATLRDVPDTDLRLLVAATPSLLSIAPGAGRHTSLLIARLLAQPSDQIRSGAITVATAAVDDPEPWLREALAASRAAGDRECADRTLAVQADLRLADGDLLAAGRALAERSDRGDRGEADGRSLVAWARWTDDGLTHRLIEDLRPSGVDEVPGGSLGAALRRLALVLAGTPAHEIDGAPMPERDDPLGPIPAVLDALATALLGAAAGDVVTSQRAFAVAGKGAADNRLEWLVALVEAFRAEALADHDPIDTAAGAERTMAIAEMRGDAWLHALGLRSRAASALSAGDVALVHRLVDEALRGVTDAFSRGQLLLLAGRAHLVGDDDQLALVALTEAARTLTDAGARLAATRAWLLAAEADPSAADALLDEARTIGPADLGVEYARCWKGRRNLSVELLGRARLRVGDEAVTPKTANATKLVVSLALAGRTGLDAAVLFERLWPGKDPRQARTNLTTATWDARRALGREAWRLRRDDERLVLDVDGVDVDLVDALRRAELAASPAEIAEAAERLRRPVLPEWGYEDWVYDLDEQRAAALARLDLDRGRS